jgi:hypothetical protein
VVWHVVMKCDKLWVNYQWCMAVSCNVSKLCKFTQRENGLNFSPVHNISPWFKLRYIQVQKQFFTCAICFFSVLMAEPILEDNASEHQTFCKYVSELLERVLGKTIHTTSCLTLSKITKVSACFDN